PVVFYFTLSYSLFFHAPATTDIYTLSLHDALPISALGIVLDGLRRLEYRGYDSAGVAIVCEDEILVEKRAGKLANLEKAVAERRSEEHTSELQSRENLVCRLLLEKKKKDKDNAIEH